MKIIYWIDLYLPHVGGSELFSAKLIPELQKRGYEVAIVTSHRGFQLPDYSIDNNIPVYRFHFWEALEKRNLEQTIAVRKQISKLKQEFQADLVHLHFGATSYFHLQTISAYPTPTLTTIHAVPEASLLSTQSFLYKTLKNSDWLNTVSPQGLDKMRKYIPEITSHSSYIYYGLNLPNLEIKTPNFDYPTLLCLGRLVFQKGFDIALDAFAFLLQLFPKIKLIIAGDGSERTTLIKQTQRLGIENNVEFKGLVEPEKVPKLLNEATIVLLPSRFEGLPIVALQAAQMSRPIVATNVDGLPELIINYKTGILIEKESVNALSDAVTFCLANPHKTIEMGQAARERFLEIFSMNSCVDSYDNLYQTIISQNTDNSR